MFASVQFVCHRAISILVVISPFAVNLCQVKGCCCYFFLFFLMGINIARVVTVDINQGRCG